MFGIDNNKRKYMQGESAPVDNSPSTEYKDFNQEEYDKWTNYKDQMGKYESNMAYGKAYGTPDDTIIENGYLFEGDRSKDILSNWKYVDGGSSGAGPSHKTGSTVMYSPKPQYSGKDYSDYIPTKTRNITASTPNVTYKYTNSNVTDGNKGYVDYGSKWVDGKWIPKDMRKI